MKPKTAKNMEKNAKNKITETFNESDWESKRSVFSKVSDKGIIIT